MLLRILGFIVLFFIGVSIAMDASQKGIRFPILWFIGCLFFPIVVIPAYFIFMRKKDYTYTAKPLTSNTILCTKCGAENNPRNEKCSKCDNQLSI
jgi:hypothetical protein